MIATITNQTQGDVESQNNPSLLGGAVVLPSVNTLKNKVGKIQLNTFAKVSRFEIKISTNNWELPWGMMEYLDR